MAMIMTVSYGPAEEESLERRRRRFFTQILSTMTRENKDFVDVYKAFPDREQYGDVTRQQFEEWRKEPMDTLFDGWNVAKYLPPPLTDEPLRESLIGVLKYPNLNQITFSRLYGAELWLAIGKGKQYNYRVAFRPDEDEYNPDSPSQPWIAPYLEGLNFTLFALSNKTQPEEIILFGLEFGIVEYSATPDENWTWEETPIRIALGKHGSGSIGSAMPDGLYLIDPSKLTKSHTDGQKARYASGMTETLVREDLNWKNDMAYACIGTTMDNITEEHTISFDPLPSLDRSTTIMVYPVMFDEGKNLFALFTEDSDDEDTEDSDDKETED